MAGNPLGVLVDGLEIEGIPIKEILFWAMFFIFIIVISWLIFLGSVLLFVWWFFFIKKDRYNFWEKALYWSIHLDIVAFGLNVCVLLILAVVFDLVHVAVGIIVTFIVTAFVWWLFCPRSILARVRKASDKYDSGGKGESDDESIVSQLLHKPLKHPIWFFGGLLFCFLYAFCLNFFLEDVCVSSEPIEITTKVSRRYAHDYCDKNVPCNIYLTFGDQMATKMIVNFHTEDDVDGFVYYDTARRRRLDDYRFKQRAKSFEMDELEIDRYIHFALLDDLQPDTVYYFRVGWGDDDDHYEEERSFRTAPLSGRFVYGQGGDQSVTRRAELLLETIAEHDPLFIVVGGDIAYANAFPTCYHKWDRWFNQWDDHARTRDGHMIPMLLAIGNHEGGYGMKDAEDFPFFLSYFPQEYDKLAEDGRYDRKSFHYHTIGQKTVIVILDSAHHRSPESQATWMRRRIPRQFRDHRFKIAAYHVPMYPAVNDFDSDKSTALRRDWIPVFDDLNFTLVFEHHDHAYARTSFRRDDEEVDSGGTVYVAAGSFGVEERDPEKRSYHVERSSRSHVVRVEIDEDSETISLDVLDHHGDKFDDVELN